MRVRPLDSNDDMTLGKPFLINSPETVEQCIRTRLRFWRGEFFADTSDGTDYMGGVLGERYNKNPDAVVRERILGTPGVDAIQTYSSTYDGSSRKFTVNAKVHTIYSTTPLNISVPVTLPG